MADFMLSDAEWQPWYAGLAKYLVRTDQPGRGMEAGLWKGTPSDLPPGTSLRYKRDEFIFIIAGRVQIDLEDGTSREIGPGEAAHFAAGETVTWTLLTDSFEEFYVYMPR